MLREIARRFQRQKLRIEFRPDRSARRRVTASHYQTVQTRTRTHFVFRHLVLRTAKKCMQLAIARRKEGQQEIDIK